MECIECGKPIPEDSNYCCYCRASQHKESSNSNQASKIKTAIKKGTRILVPIAEEVFIEVAEDKVPEIKKAIKKGAIKVSDQVLIKIGIKKETPIAHAKKIFRNIGKKR